MGDGALYRHKHDYIMKYEVKDRSFIKSFEKDVRKVYGLAMTKGFNRSGKTGVMIPYVKVRSKEAFEDLMSYGEYKSAAWSIPEAVKAAGEDVRIEFIRAFFDDEGSVVPREARFYSTNIEGISGMAGLLRGFGIETILRAGFGSRRNVYALTLKRENLRLFADKIGFGLKRKQRKMLKELTRLAKVRSAR